MKKIIALVMILCMVAGLLAGCGSTNTDTGNSGSAPVAENTPVPEESTAEPAAEEPAAEEPAPEETVAESNNINVAMGYQIVTLDNAVTTETGNSYVLDHLYSGMFRLDKDGVAQKELCEDYTVSEDGLTYTFTLKDGLVWSDGSPITASDFEYSLLRALSYGTINAYALKETVTYLKGARAYNEHACEVGNDFDCTVEDHSDVGINVVDDKTLVIELDAPCAFLPVLMTQRAWLPMHKSAPQHDSLWSLEPGFPTSGPYVLSEINPTEKAVLVKSDTYFNADAITADTVTFWCMTDQDAQALAFETGEIDVALTIASSAADKYVGTDNLLLINEGTTYFIAINSAETGPEYLKDVNVRRALALAIDNSAVSEVLGAAYFPAVNGYIPHGVAGVEGDFREEGDADGFSLVYDPDQAKQLLAEAGYDEKNPLTVNYRYSNNSVHGDVATMVQAFWNAIGINVNLDSVEYSVYYDQIDQGEFEVCRYADTVSGNVMRLLKMWTTDGQVVPAVSDPVFDKMVDETIQIGNPVEYAKALHELEDYLVEENVYLIPIFEYTIPVLIKDGISGVTLDGVLPFFGYCTVG